MWSAPTPTSGNTRNWHVMEPNSASSTSPRPAITPTAKRMVACTQIKRSSLSQYQSLTIRPLNTHYQHNSILWRVWMNNLTEITVAVRIPSNSYSHSIVDVSENHQWLHKVASASIERKSSTTSSTRNNNHTSINIRKQHSNRLLSRFWELTSPRHRNFSRSHRVVQKRR